ncbi:hypothetical protein D3C87_1567480 [compost metagenome]
MRRGLREGLLQGVRAAGVGVGNDEARLVETGLGADAEGRPVSGHDLSRQGQVIEAAAHAGARRGEDVGKGLGRHADDGGHLADVGDPQRSALPRQEHQDAGQAIEGRRHAAPPEGRIDHDEAQMHDLGRAAFQFGLQQRQDVEGDRPGGRALALIDHGHDAVPQPLGVAAQNAIGQGGLIQRGLGHRPQVGR